MLLSVISARFIVAIILPGRLQRDGIKYFIMPGSATDAIINVTSTSNIGQPGRWMFRLDLEKIQGTTCNTNGKTIRLHDI